MEESGVRGGRQHGIGRPAAQRLQRVGHSPEMPRPIHSASARVSRLLPAFARVWCIFWLEGCTQLLGKTSLPLLSVGLLIRSAVDLRRGRQKTIDLVLSPRHGFVCWCAKMRDHLAYQILIPIRDPVTCQTLRQGKPRKCFVPVVVFGRGGLEGQVRWCSVCWRLA